MKRSVLACLAADLVSTEAGASYRFIAIVSDLHLDEQRDEQKDRHQAVAFSELLDYLHESSAGAGGSDRFAVIFQTVIQERAAFLLRWRGSWRSQSQIKLSEQPPPRRRWLQGLSIGN